jgi:hypothetical protein
MNFILQGAQMRFMVRAAFPYFGKYCNKKGAWQRAGLIRAGGAACPS